MSDPAELTLRVGVAVNTGVLFLQTWAQGRTLAVRASVVFSMEPVFAALF